MHHAPHMVCGYILIRIFLDEIGISEVNQLQSEHRAVASYTPPLSLLPKAIYIDYVMPATRPDEAAYQCPSYTYLTIPTYFNQSGSHPTYRSHVQCHFTTPTLRIMLPQIVEY